MGSEMCIRDRPSPDTTSTSDHATFTTNRALHFVAMTAVVWTFWIAPFLVVGAILAIVGVIAGYLMNVTSKQYPRGKQKRK